MRVLLCWKCISPCTVEIYLLSFSDFDTVEEKQQVVELMAFATLPRIKICGHDKIYDALQGDLIADRYSEEMFVDIMTKLQSHYNCLKLSCEDIGRHTQDSTSPECVDNFDLAGYSPMNGTKTNMVSFMHVLNIS